MAQRRAPASTDPTIRKRARSVGHVAAENGREVARPEAEQAEPNVVLSAGARAALSAIGAWANMDWEETLAELDRIRHESKPSPPLDDL